jgi:hypothetical protein
MSNIALLLGQIAFQDFEVPASINIGGDQRLAIHRLLGGARIIDALGREECDITFSGVFSGETATFRARAVDQMRVSGLAMPLTWDVFFYAVIIKRFEADYRSGWWIPYRITCIVVADEASSALDPVLSLTNSALTDVTTACAFASAVGIDLSSTQSAIVAPDAAVRGTASYSSALVALASSGVAVAAGISLAESTLGAASWPVEGSMSSAANSINALVSAAQKISCLTNAQSYIGRTSVNLTNAST